MKHHAFTIIWLFFNLAAFAQADSYQFTRLNVNHGLSHNQINCFLRDSRGFMWVGTSSGLNRFDGYTFKSFKNNVSDSTSLPYNDIRNLFEDPDGRIWIVTNFTTSVYDPRLERFYRDPAIMFREYSIPPGTINAIVKDSKGYFWFVHEQEGLFRYDARSKEPLHVLVVPKERRAVSSFMEDNRGDFWIVYRNGLFEKVDGKKYRTVYTCDLLLKRYPNEYPVYSMAIDKENDLWIYNPDNFNRGAFYFNTSRKSLRHITTKGEDGLKLNNDIVRDIVVGDNGLIWVSTDHGGINLIDKKRSTVRYILHDPEDDKSLSQNSINALYKDNEGIIWVGTFKKGLSYYHENMNKFALYRHQVSGAASLPHDDINQFVEDDRGNLWIGTNGGGLVYFNRSTNTFRQYQHDPRNPNSLSNNIIVSLCFDHEKKLWIGTYFGGLNCFDGKKFIRYRHDKKNPRSLPDDSVWEIIEDSNNNLWIGTLTGSVAVLGPDRKEFRSFTTPDGIYSGYVPALMEDGNGTIWVGTGYGVCLLKKGAEKFTNIIGNGTPGSLSNNNVLSLLDDSRGLVWVGTQEGLNLYNPATGTFRAFREDDGLPHNTILSILEDNTGNLWISTPNGISNMEVGTDPLNKDFSPSFRNYDESDGLQGRQFNESAALKTRSGELIFGGPNGFNLFRPDDIKLNKTKPPVVLIDFHIYDNSLQTGEKVNNRVVLPQSITVTDEVTLRHSDNVFSIEFAALSYFHPERNHYKYKLEGFNKEWLTTDGRSRKVTYTNLDPGDYVFTVVASNSDGFWNEEGASLRITVLPPFWKTKWAFGLYGLVILGALLLSRRLIQERERMRYRIEQERQEAHRTHELDMLKIKFFTNVSHEFRTPLSLILTPVERMLASASDAREKEQYQMIHRNARRLLNLVNQLLDFRKMEVEEIRLNESEGDVIAFLKEVVQSFSDLSEKKNIRLEFTTSVGKLETLFDQDKLEKIMFNLLSNAFKFTPEGGSVTVSLTLQESEKARQLAIAVADTGIGIPKENHTRIFERFFQNDLPKSMVNQGSGIGLSITKEFVRIHGGSIHLESEPDKGSCFTVLIPVKEISEIVVAEKPPVVELPKVNAAADMVLRDDQYVSGNGKSKPVILLVEDNEDFRFYLKDNLKVYYQLIEAANGLEGWKAAQQHLPDLVVSDVMMPEMNGIDLCRKLKNDRHTSHIPVILLTARTAPDQKMEGYQTGADDYVTKPFNFEILLSRIKNLISLRASLHQSFHQKIDVKASEISITSLDETLIKNALKSVEDRLSDPDFSVEDLSRELGMSRVHLYKKLLSLTGKSPLEFIRTIRLQRAAQLLEKSQLTVAEVAYKVGFNNPKYFAKYFREEYHVLPSHYGARKKS